MASSRGTSNGPDWKDVHQAVLNYESFWGARITLSIQSDGSPDAPYLTLQAKAEPVEGSSGVPLHSVWVLSTMRQLNAVSLDAAFLTLLHRLDREWYVATPLGGN